MNHMEDVFLRVRAEMRPDGSARFYMYGTDVQLHEFVCTGKMVFPESEFSLQKHEEVPEAPEVPVAPSSPISDSESVLLEADRIVRGVRQDHYGAPAQNHGLTAAFWSVLFGKPISAKQVTLANILQKIAREMHAYKRDNFVDIAGYAENGRLCAEEELKKEPS